MKKAISFLLVSLILLTTVNVSAFNDTKQEVITKQTAIANIEKALEDPETCAWVNKKFGSEKLFLKAIKLAPEKTVLKIANTFSDFQQYGGDLETAAEAATWVWIVLAIIAIGSTIYLIALL